MLTIFTVNQCYTEKVKRILNQLEEKGLLIDISFKEDDIYSVEEVKTYVVNETEKNVTKLNEILIDNNIEYSYRAKHLVNVANYGDRGFKELINILKDYEFFSHNLLAPKDLPNVYRKVYDILQEGRVIRECLLQENYLEYSVDSFKCDNVVNKIKKPIQQANKIISEYNQDKTKEEKFDIKLFIAIFRLESVLY